VKNEVLAYITDNYFKNVSCKYHRKDKLSLWYLRQQPKEKEKK